MPNLNERLRYYERLFAITNVNGVLLFLLQVALHSFLKWNFWRSRVKEESCDELFKFFYAYSCYLLLVCVSLRLRRTVLSGCILYSVDKWSRQFIWTWLYAAICSQLSSLVLLSTYVFTDPSHAFQLPDLSDVPTEYDIWLRLHMKFHQPMSCALIFKRTSVRCIYLWHYRSHLCNCTFM